MFQVAFFKDMRTPICSVVKRRGFTRESVHQSADGVCMFVSFYLVPHSSRTLGVQQEWQELTDDGGNKYWYNSDSGVSQYENPLGGPAWTGGSITTASDGEGQGL